MKKYLTTFSLYDGERKFLYENYAKPRFQRYAEIHGLEFIEFNEKNFSIQTLHPEFDSRENMHFNRWLQFKKMISDGMIKDGDIIYNFDADIFIKEMDQFFIPEKGFTYAIDSGNTHCFGFFALKINDFSKKLIDLIVNRERWLKLKDYIFFNEHYNQYCKWHIADQQMYYTCAGIKPHSWQSFYELPHCGLHSYVTEHTVFSLDELYKNVNILPTEWNVTQLLEETGSNGKPNTYDIVKSSIDKTIFRHFAGGQKWRFEEYSKLYKII